MSHNPYCQYSNSKYFEEMKNKPYGGIVDGKFGNISLSTLKSDKNLATTLMDAFKKSLSINEPFPEVMKNPYLPELVLKYDKKHAEVRGLRNTTTTPKTSYCIACTSHEIKPQIRTNDLTGYLSELLCDVCIKKLKTTKEFASAQPKPNGPQKMALPRSTKTHTQPDHITDEPLFASSKTANSDDELNMYWLEVRNAIYQVFMQEGFHLNSVVKKYINPPLCHYCMPSKGMLKAMVKKLYQAHQHKFFLLTVCHVQLFIMEIKLCLLKELIHLEKPYFIFAIFYTLFQRLLRALQRTNAFLDIIETEFLKKNSLHWLQIHFLFFQTFVYMNRFIQKSISLLCDCSTENGLKTEDNDESRMVGKIVYRSYVILEQSMASFSIYTNTNSSNFAVFFSKFDDFQMLFQFAILLFNCKNYDENIFAKRFFSADFTVKNLQDMPHLSKELLQIDALNTVAFQLFLVIHHWDSTEVFDNVMRRLPTVECSKSSRSIIKTILHESFIEVGYDEPTLLADFYKFIGQDMPNNCCFDEYLAQEICLSDEENYDDESFCSEDSFSHFRHGHHDCACDYSDMFCHTGDHLFPSSRRSFEMRERLRHRLSNRRRVKLSDQKRDNFAVDDGSERKQTDERNLDDLLNFINGDNEGDKKRKKANSNGMDGEEGHSKEGRKKKKKQKKKQKNKDTKNSQHDVECCIPLDEGKETAENGDVEIEVIDEEEEEAEENCETISYPDSDVGEMEHVKVEEVSDAIPNILNPDEVFKPKDIDLDSEDLDEFEKELERFKRFCYNSMSSTLDSCKPKLAINVKEIFSKRQACKPSVP